ncbi:AzlD domain-containing protein [Mangrovitalea sediminis]|uniref:AzlD domain-containing protein n=1 Tax=Mangrovitalea sediminis TaxID=1982043 RepID=UPI000BE5944F|nr:AzlD domain-containing protein [Mangrovitalea sediminis]
MEPKDFWFTIVGAGLITLVLRLSFIALSDVLKLPPLAQRALHFVPPAILSALVWPTVVIRHGQLDLSVHNFYLIATLIAAIVAWRTRNIFLTLLVGMAAFWLLQYWWG